MRITDSQIHIWEGGTRPGEAHKASPFGHEQLIPLMDEAGVDRAVVIPPSWSTDGNDIAIRAARAHPRRLGAMGVLSLDLPESRDRLAGWRSQPGMLGIRQVFNREPYIGWLRDGTIDWFWTAAERAGVPVMVSPYGLLGAISEVARKHPGLRLVIDHCGVRSTTRGTERARQVAELVRLAPLANVAVKASRLPLISDEPYPFSDVHQEVRRVLDAFGPHRVFWGSDLTWLRCSYREAVTMMTTVLEGLDPDEKDLVMGRALSEWLGWPE